MAVEDPVIWSGLINQPANTEKKDGQEQIWLNHNKQKTSSQSVTKQFTLFVHKANFDLFWVGELDKANAIKLGQNEAEMVGKRRQKMNN